MASSSFLIPFCWISYIMDFLTSDLPLSRLLPSHQSKKCSTVSPLLPSRRQYRLRESLSKLCSFLPCLQGSWCLSYRPSSDRRHGQSFHTMGHKFLRLLQGFWSRMKAWVVTLIPLSSLHGLRKGSPTFSALCQLFASTSSLLCKHHKTTSLYGLHPWH